MTTIDVKGTLKGNNNLFQIDKLTSENSNGIFFAIVSSLLAEKMKVEVSLLNFAPKSMCMVCQNFQNVMFIFPQHCLNEICPNLVC